MKKIITITATIFCFNIFIVTNVFALAAPQPGDPVAEFQTYVGTDVFHQDLSVVQNADINIANIQQHLLFSNPKPAGDLGMCNNTVNIGFVDTNGRFVICTDTNGDGTPDELNSGGGPLVANPLDQSIRLSGLLSGYNWKMDLDFVDLADGSADAYVAFQGIPNGFYVTGTKDDWAAASIPIKFTGPQMFYVPAGNVFVAGSFSSGVDETDLNSSTDLALIGKDLSISAKREHVYVFGSDSIDVDGDKNVIIGGENVRTHSDGITFMGTYGAGQVDITGNGLVLMANAAGDTFDIKIQESIALVSQQVIISPGDSNNQIAAPNYNSTLDVEGAISFGYEDSSGDARRMYVNGTHGTPLVQTSFRLDPGPTDHSISFYNTHADYRARPYTKTAPGDYTVSLHNAKYCVQNTQVTTLTQVDTVGGEAPLVANVQYSWNATTGDVLRIRTYDLSGTPQDGTFNVHTSCEILTSDSPSPAPKPVYPVMMDAYEAAPAEMDL